jgi:uncharacterized phiE125 gp8 family phage protein
VASITTRDASGVLTTWDPTKYQVDTRAEPGRIFPLGSTGWWPALAPGVLAPITIRFVAGYGVRALDIPEPLRLGLLAIAGQFYSSRDTAGPVPTWIEQLIAPYRMTAAA